MHLTPFPFAEIIPPQGIWAMVPCVCACTCTFFLHLILSTFYYLRSGYSGNGTVCRPVCALCSRGVCTAPSTCSCPPGWAGPSCDNCLTNAVCAANATCIFSNVLSPGLGVCTCNEGFAGTGFNPLPGQESVSQFLIRTNYLRGSGYNTSITPPSCLPTCRNPCINGYCSSPNKCYCDATWGGLTCTECPVINTCFMACQKVQCPQRILKAVYFY
jgi:hypothetical protein